MEASGHERYAELAVGHVLGGLDAVDSAEFRSHLLGCRTCRLRVAELRDLASELAAAEREERATARLKTEIRADPDGDPTAAGTDDAHVPGRRTLVVVALISALAIAGGFWAHQLRTQNAVLLEATERREATLALLGEGQQVESELAAGVSGPVVADDTMIAFSLAGLPEELPDDHALVVWLTFADGDARWISVLRGSVPDGRLALHEEHDGAVELLVSLQPAAPLDGPGGRTLARAELDEPSTR